MMDRVQCDNFLSALNISHTSATCQPCKPTKLTLNQNVGIKCAVDDVSHDTLNSRLSLWYMCNLKTKEGIILN